MKIAPKLAVLTTGIILVLVIVGSLGMFASNRLIRHFEGGQDQLKTIVLEASEISGLAKRIENNLMLFLMLHAPEDKEILQGRLDSLQHHITLLQKTINTASAAEAFNKIKTGADRLLPLCNELTTAHDLELREAGFFTAEPHKELILELHALTSDIRHAGLELTSFATESLNRQLAITTASEISSTAKTMYSHLLIFLTLQNPEEKTAFFEEYSLLQDQIALLERRLRNPTAVETLARIKKQAADILPTAEELLRTMEDDLDNNGEYRAEDHRTSIIRLYKATSEVRESGTELTLFNANQEVLTKDNAIRETRGLQRHILFIWSMAILVALIIGHLLANSIIRPIKELQRATVEIARGELTTEIDVNSRDEFGQLAENFREMAMTLFLRTKALRSSNEQLQHEINERRLAEEALQKNEAFYRAIVEDQTELICRYRPDGTLTFVNEAYCNYFGKPREELLNRPFMHLIPAEDRGRVESSLATLTPANQVITHEHRVILPGGVLRWQQWTNRIILDETDNLIEYQAVGRDITDQRIMEQAIRHNAEKIKLFAYSVSHDLKNPAIAIYGLSKILLAKYKNSMDERGQVCCQQIFHSSEQVAALVDKINQYISTTESPLKIESINLEQLLKMIADEFALQLQLRQITWQTPELLPELHGDRLAILRVLRNFVDNALKYGGESLSNIRFGYEETERHHILSVSNDGASIPEKSYAKIFRVFQRDETSSGITGTGLGLAIVKEITGQHGGSAWLGPREGGGVTFFISIAKGLSVPLPAGEPSAPRIQT